MRKILHLTEEEIEFIGINKKAKVPVYNEFLLEYEKSNHQDLDSFLRLMPTEEDDINFLLQKTLILRLMRSHQVYIKLMMITPIEII